MAQIGLGSPLGGFPASTRQLSLLIMDNVSSNRCLFPKRRRKTAAERRAQRLRAHARLTQSLLKEFASLSHRGSQLSKIGASLQMALRSHGTPSSDSRQIPECWHFRNGFCKLGVACKFAHVATSAPSPTNTSGHAAEPSVAPAPSLAHQPAQAPPKSILKSTPLGFASADEVYSAGVYTSWQHDPSKQTASAGDSVPNSLRPSGG